MHKTAVVDRLAGSQGLVATVTVVPNVEFENVSELDRDRKVVFNFGV